MNSPGLTFGLVNPELFSTQFFWDVGFIGFFLVVIQGILTLVFGHHGDASGDGQGISWSNFLSLKTMAAMFLGIGFGGAAFGENGFSLAVAATGGAAWCSRPSLSS